MKIYLSGGMKGTWQDTVKNDASQHIYVDPRHHDLVLPDQYTLWDLAALSRCDLVFAYLASDNPSGIGLAVEVGYMRARGLFIILVDEKPDDARWCMVRECADVVVASLAEGLQIIKNLP